MNTTRTQYAEIVIAPAHGGFGEYVCFPATGDWYDDRTDLLADIRQDANVDVYDRDVEIPDGIEDIRGRIHNEPSEVFAVRWPVDPHTGAHPITYFGIATREVEDSAE